jgi:LmbE family N-acetylglucosaminyl deacetylase
MAEPSSGQASDVHYDAIFLSPHLDDVALSCLALLQRERLRGKRSLIVTVFASGGPEHVARRIEDAAAAELLGADVSWCGFPDAPFRSERYRSFSGIVFDQRRDSADDALVDSLTAHISALVTRHRPARIYAPLGAGGHIDHRLVHEAAMRALWSESTRLWCYEDRPYALVRGMVELRLAALGERRRAFDAASFARFAFDLARVHYLRSYVEPADVLLAVPRLIERLQKPVAPPSHWKIEMVFGSPELIGLGWRMLSCYASQWRTLYGSMESFADWTRNYGNSISPIPGYIERLWQRSSG